MTYFNISQPWQPGGLIFNRFSNNGNVIGTCNRNRIGTLKNSILTYFIW